MGGTEGTLLALWRNPATRRIPGTWRSSASSRSSSRPCRRRSRGCRRSSRVRALAGAAARCRLLRHARPRSGRSPHHPAAADRRHRRGMAPQIARRPGRPNRGEGAARRTRRTPTRYRRNCWTSCSPSSAIVRSRPVARITTSRTVDLLYGHDGARACRVLRRPGDRSGRPATAMNSGGGSGSWSWPRASSRDLLRPADEPAARRGRSSRRPRLEARAGAGIGGRTGGRGVRATRRPGAPRGGRAGGAAAGVGSRGAGRCLRLGAPDAGDHAQDPQPAAGVGGVRSVSPTTPGFSTSCGSWRRFWGWRATPRCWPSATSGRSTSCPLSWSADRCGSGWSTAPRSTTRPVCGDR